MKPHAKATALEPTESRPVRVTRIFGAIATRSASLRLAGSDAPSHRSATTTPTGAVRGAVGVLAVVAGTLILAASALASGAPYFDEANPLLKEIHSTRVAMLATIRSNELETEWQSAYATSPSGPWTVLTAGTEEGGANALIQIELGYAEGASRFEGVRHLSPDTQYYARFFAKNKAGEATEIVPFKTLPVAEPEFPQGAFLFQADGPHRAAIAAQVETNGSQTEYHFEYAPFETGPWTACGGGSVTVAEDYADPEAQCTGLNPETMYYGRIRASNAAGENEKVRSSTTPTAKPAVAKPGVRNVTATSAHLTSSVDPRGSKTMWRFEFAASEKGPWTPIPGAAGTISQAQAEALPSSGGIVDVEATFSNLSPTTTYYVRLFAENECASGCGEGVNGLGEPISTATGDIVENFRTSGRPLASTFATHALHGESVRLIGAVNPNSIPTSEEQTIAFAGSPTGGTFALAFNGQSTGGSSTGALTSASPTVTGIPLPAVKGTGNVSYPPECKGPARGSGRCFAVTGVTASVGEFRPGQAISGPGIAPGAHINSVHGSTLELSRENTEAVSGAQLTSAEPSSFTVGESISGAGVPAGTTIAAVEYPADFTATLTLSANATGGASGVALTANLPFDATSDTVAAALSNLSSVPPDADVQVTGSSGGPFTVYFANSLAETNQPQIEADASGLTPSGSSITVATPQQGGVAYDSRYHFEYEPVEGGIAPFTQAGSTASVDVGSGASRIVATDLPQLQAGVSYRYRIVATNNSPGNPVVDGEEQTLTAPAATTPASAEACPNAALRTGPSASLPDCRAYEQLTPANKEGAQEPFHYGGGIGSYALAGEDGEHLVLDAESVNWGSGVGAGHSPYFFARTPGGWRMTAASTEPEFGVDKLESQVFAPDLTSFAFESGFSTSEVVESKDVEFRVGPPGGPYTTVATVPRKQLAVANTKAGWVAASADFSKLILEVADRTLVEPASSTKSGFDLYEYSGGQLRQTNVQSNGERIGACGATIVKGNEESGQTSSAHSVSADGSRVFFEAVPGTDCSAPMHLYERVGATQTLDLGPGKFLAAKADGSEVLFEHTTGEAHEILLYEGGSGTTTPLFTTHQQLQELIRVSSDLTTIYFASSELLTPDAPAIGAGSQAVDIYRYDVSARALHFLLQVTPSSEGLQLQGVSPDGRYAYFQALEAAGVPGGVVNQEVLARGTSLEQAYRYDSLESVVECVSCASPFDPEPRLGAALSTRETKVIANGALPSYTAVSADGDYAFFSTPAALLPSDVDGEINPESGGVLKVEGKEEANPSPDTSPSSDVYEWRRQGVDGCSHVQGCLALITNGRGGFLNYLLGSAHEGRDVFIYTGSQLLPQDNDSAGDIYDARVGGGTPPPAPAPVECEASACSTPFAAPNDLTPSSATFHGAGNPTAATKPTSKAKPKKHKPKKRRTKKRKHSARSKRSAKKTKARKTSDKRRARR